jgi:hypothetical protein
MRVALSGILRQATAVAAIFGVILAVTLSASRAEDKT